MSPCIWQTLAELPGEPYRWVLLVLLGVIGFFYLAVPLLICGQQKFEARPTMLRFDVDEYEWPAEIQRLFVESIGELTELGFEVVDGLFLPSAVQNVKTALVLLVHPDEVDAAMVTAMYAQPVSASSLKTLYVEFSTTFDDGSIYDVNNSSQMGSFPRREEMHLCQLVKVQDVRSLYCVHQAVLRHAGRNQSQKVLPLDEQFDGDAVAYLQHAMEREFQAASEQGYLKRASDGRSYQPTLKGAYLMVWKELWPWKLVRKHHRDMQARAVLEDLAREGRQIDV